ncbi:MAG TPA: glycoside hydrolase family 3 N-terminal domain-containing protein [Bacteroidales bacterium]|nr:glycoside hydrolase family 3 N-terminal domain-containing protein [Bacteroidales bacterium]
MKKHYLFFTGLLALAVSCSQGPSGSMSDSDLNIERRVDSVLAKMTLEEKVGQMNQISTGGAATGPVLGNNNDMTDLRAGKIGSILNLVGAERTREAQEIAVNETRMGIPLIFGLDVIHGYRTIFPTPLGESASWDTVGIKESARIAAIEASAQGVHWTFAPMVDISRDPRWGRIMEGAGEDPFLGSMIARARVEGFQGKSLTDNNTIVACAKHYAAYGAAEGGRDYNTVDISMRTLNDIYLPPFHAAVEAGVGTFMNSFNEIAGIPSTGNEYLLRDKLKGEWGFKGFVVSDWNSIGELVNHGVAADEEEAAEIAIKAGSDMDMVSGSYLENLPRLVKDGVVDEKLIDDAVRRILRIKFQLGLFDDPYKYCSVERENELLLHPSHREHARDIARKSIVLLKNEGQVLPVSKKTRTLAVIGPLADSKKDLLCTWTAKGQPDEAVSLLDGIKKKVDDGTRILYEKGCDITGDSKAGFASALSAARRADIVILAVGEAGDMSGEAHSRAYIGIPGVQPDLIKEIQKTGKPVVVVLMNGRPVTFEWTAKNMPAILETWFLGTEGGDAIADVLFGDYNPSGKLPVSIPVTVGQIPVYYNHKNTGRPFEKGEFFTSRYLDIPNEPLYPFGYGLSYTTFKYSDISLNKTKIAFSEPLIVKVKVTNTGEYDGEEVVQLYTRDMVASVTRPVKELKGFKKVMIEKGETAEISFELTSDDLRFYNDKMDFVAEPGDFKVFVGTSSDNVKEASFKLIENGSKD